MGVTHLSIALATYLSCRHGYRIACLEYNSSTAFNELSQQCRLPFSKNGDDLKSFSIKQVDYYPNVSKQDISTHMNEGYHYLIFDFGVLSDDTLDDFYRCNHKIIIGCLAPWKQTRFYEFLKHKNNKAIKERCRYLIINGEKSDILDLSEIAHVPRQHIQCIPFLKNPFHIKKDFFPFLEGLL